MFDQPKLFTLFFLVCFLVFSAFGAESYTVASAISSRCALEDKQAVKELGEDNRERGANHLRYDSTGDHLVKDSFTSLHDKTWLNNAVCLSKKVDIHEQLNKKMDSVAMLFKFKWGLTADQFTDLNPEAAKVIKRMKYTSSGYERKYSGIGQPFPEGAWAYMPDKFSTNKGVIYTVVAKRSKTGDEGANSAYDMWKTYFIANFPPETISQKDGYIVVSSPNSMRKITFYKISVLNITSLFFLFSEGEGGSDSTKKI